MQCPKCPGEMQTQTYGRKITIHRCCECGGIFCQPDVLLEMRREQMSEIVLDSGDPKVGGRLDKIGDINCPECGIAMDKTYDKNQTHIWYEQCGQCEGMYFDAGEFSDLKSDTFLDRIRDIFKGARPDT